MKTLALTIMLILTSPALQGQDLTGQWNGTLQVQGNPIRIVFHVTKANNQYVATLDSPDQNAYGTQVTAINFSYPNVKFEVSSIGAVYEGTLSDKSITGKWVQSGTALFLVLKSEGLLNKEKGKD